MSCASCGKSGAKGIPTCCKNSQVRYCGEECADAHWKVHFESIEHKPGRYPRGQQRDPDLDDAMALMAHDNLIFPIEKVVALEFWEDGPLFINFRSGQKISIQASFYEIDDISDSIAKELNRVFEGDVLSVKDVNDVEWTIPLKAIEAISVDYKTIILDTNKKILLHRELDEQQKKKWYSYYNYDTFDENSLMDVVNTLWHAPGMPGAEEAKENFREDAHKNDTDHGQKRQRN